MRWGEMRLTLLDRSVCHSHHDHNAREGRADGQTENRGIGSSAAVCVAHRNRPTPQWPRPADAVTQKQPHPAWHG